jgi:hypothetical protein
VVITSSIAPRVVARICTDAQRDYVLRTETLYGVAATAADANARTVAERPIPQRGAASANKALATAYISDAQKAEYTSVPVTLVILVLASEHWWPPAFRCCSA